MCSGSLIVVMQGSGNQCAPLLLPCPQSARPQVELLAQCLGLLVAQGRWHWPQVELLVTLSYSSVAKFLCHANASYRMLAVVVLAAALQVCCLGRRLQAS